MIRMMLVFVILAVAQPCFAQWGYPVQSVHDSGNTYVLYSSGNITREYGWGRREIIDNGTGSRMIAAGDGNLYVLKNNGNIWWWRGGMSWTMIDNGTGTSKIWMTWGALYCRKNNGQIWRCIDPYRMEWQLENDFRAMKQVENFGKLTAGL